MNSVCNVHANLPFRENYAADVRPVTPRDCELQSDLPLEIKLPKKILEGNLLACSYQQYVKLHQWYSNNGTLFIKDHCCEQQLWKNPFCITINSLKNCSV